MKSTKSTKGRGQALTKRKGIAPGKDGSTATIFPGLLRAAADLGDEALSLDLGKRVVEGDFDIRNGEEVEDLAGEVALSGALLETATGELDALNRQIAAEPLRIPACHENGGTGDPHAEIPPWRWASLDQFVGFLALLVFGAITLASFFGVAATFQNAELEIFDRNPHLPFMLAVLPPAAAIAFKFAGQAFRDQAMRDRFRALVLIGGGIGLFVWIPLWAAIFEGLGGVFDPFAEPNHLLGWGFNVTHVVAEVLIGASSFQILSDIWAKYTPSHDIPNPKLPPLVEAREAVKAEIEALSARHHTAKGAHRALMGQLKLNHAAAEIGIQERLQQGTRQTVLST